MVENGKPSRGPNLEVATPSAAERDWIFIQLHEPATHQRLSLPHAPTRAAFEAGKVVLVEHEGRHVDVVGTFIVRQHDAPWGFLLHFGWEFQRDSTQELDLVVAGESQHSPGLLFEAHVLAAHFMFSNGLAKRLRWRVPQRGDRPAGWYTRLGARALGTIDEPHPQTGAPIRKQVYELSRAEFDVLCAGEDPPDPRKLWTKQRRSKVLPGL